MLLTTERRVRPSLIGLLLVTILALLSSCLPTTLAAQLPICASGTSPFTLTGGVGYEVRRGDDSTVVSSHTTIHVALGVALVWQTAYPGIAFTVWPPVTAHWRITCVVGAPIVLPPLPPPPPPPPVDTTPPPPPFTLSRVITEADVREVAGGILSVMIQVHRLSGEVVAGIPTTWTVEVGGGMGEQAERSLTLMTDGAGRAQTSWSLTADVENRLRITADSALDRLVRWPGTPPPPPPATPVYEILLFTDPPPSGDVQTITIAVQRISDGRRELDRAVRWLSESGSGIGSPPLPDVTLTTGTGGHIVAPWTTVPGVVNRVRARTDSAAELVVTRDRRVTETPPPATSIAAVDGLVVAVRLVADSVEADIRWTPATSWQAGDSVRISGTLGAIVGTLVDTALAPDAESILIRRPFDSAGGQFICARFIQSVAAVRTAGAGRAVYGEVAGWQGSLRVRGPQWEEGVPSCVGYDLPSPGTNE